MTSTYDFTLVLDGVRSLSIDQVEKIYARCKDATESESDGVVRLGFTRKAKSFAEAVHRALRDLRRCGFRVARVETEDLVSAAEIAARMKRSRESVRLLIEGRRGPGNFPPPVSTVGERFRLWRSSQVERWFASYEKRKARIEDHGAVVAAINLILALRGQPGALPAGVRRELARVAKEEQSAMIFA